MSTFNNQYQQERLASLKGQLAYTEEALKTELEPWERKEYEMVTAECQKDINELEACMAEPIAA